MYSLARRTFEHDGTRAIEAPFIVRRNGYYWLFVSFDRQPTDYKIMVGRSKDITGPYFDFDGTPMMEGGGSLVLDAYEDIIAPGHNGILLNDNGTDWLIHHYKDARFDGDRTLMMHELIWGTGWLARRRRTPRSRRFASAVGAVPIGRFCAFGQFQR